MNKIAIIVAMAALPVFSGCVQDGTTSSTVTAQPDTAASNIEPVSGISKDALAAIMGLPDLNNEMLYGVFFYPDKIDNAQLKAAPARICASRGLKLVSAEVKPLEHQSDVPGAQKMMVRCK